MKLILVDDHPLFIEGLQYLLKTYGIEIIGVANDGKEALRKAKLLNPDIILMDIKMPGCSGIDVLKLIKADRPDIKIVMLTTSDEDEDLLAAIKYGASGYLLKSTNAKTLVDILTGIEKGEVSLSPGIAAELLKEFRGRSREEQRVTDEQERISQPAEQKRRGQLTHKQLKILELVARGITYKEAGDILGMTERTLKYHMSRIIELLHLENRSQVIAYAVRTGIINDTKTD